jgi:hypothetical protein
MIVIELLQETKEDNIVWYAVYRDGEYVTGSYSQKKAKKYFETATQSRFIKPAKVIKREILERCVIKVG